MLGGVLSFLLAVPSLLERRGLRGGDLYRHDRAVHLLYDPGLPALADGRRLPARRLAPGALEPADQRGRHGWVAFISVLFMLPTRRPIDRDNFNYTPIVVLGSSWRADRLVHGQRAPLVHRAADQGSEAQLAAIEQDMGEASIDLSLA